MHELSMGCWQCGGGHSGRIALGPESRDAWARRRSATRGAGAARSGGCRSIKKSQAARATEKQRGNCARGGERHGNQK
jgi:hypothetical protein